MNIRKFEPKDAEFCFKVRSDVYIQKFHDELSPSEIAVCVTAYTPKDYICMAKKVEFFIIEENNQAIGFFTVRRKNQTTAELPLIYIDLNHIGKGIGRACVHYIEEWIASNWSGVQTLYLDTIIPKYNSGFYRKVGFTLTKETFCEFPGLRIKAIRFSKELKP